MCLLAAYIKQMFLRELNSYKFKASFGVLFVLLEKEEKFSLIT